MFHLMSSEKKCIIAKGVFRMYQCHTTFLYNKPTKSHLVKNIYLFVLFILVTHPYSRTSKQRTLWDHSLCSLFGGCPLLGGCHIFVLYTPLRPKTSWFGGTTWINMMFMMKIYGNNGDKKTNCMLCTCSLQPISLCLTI